jgi:hypothetical protein
MVSLSLPPSSFSFLFGAGASVSAGIPVMRTMGENFLAIVTKNSPDLLPAFEAVPKHGKSESWHTGRNIEALLFFLYSAQDLSLNGPASHSAGFFDGEPDEAMKDRQELARLAAILALQACSFILDATSHYTGSRSYLTPFLELLPTEGGLDIFTLNYDSVVEDFCTEHQVLCVDGFDGEGRWRPSLLYQDYHERRWLRLWKLHGSVTWIKDQASQNPKKAPLPGTWERRVLTGHSSSPTTETNLIYPGLGKTPSGQMRLLFDGFQERIQHAECRVLIAVGYSFADDDVRDVVCAALAQNRSLHLLIVSGESSEKYADDLKSRHPDVASRISALRGRFDAVLKDGSLDAEIYKFASTEPSKSDSHDTGLEDKDLTRRDKASLGGDVTSPPDRTSRPALTPRVSQAPLRLLCPGEFRSVRRLTSKDRGVLLLTDGMAGGSSRLLRFEVRSHKIDVLAAFIGEATKFVAGDAGVCTVVDTKLHNFQAGIGTCWQVDLNTGERWPLLPGVIADPDELRRVARARHRPVSDAEQANGLEEYGILHWPTAVEALPGDPETFLIVMSNSVLCAKRGQRPENWRRFPMCKFLNLTIAAHLTDSLFLLLENVRGAQGALWRININAPAAEPEFLFGGVREPGGLVVLPDRRHVLFTENISGGNGRLWRVDLEDGCRAKLLRDDLERPGEMVLLTDHSVAMIMRDAVREVPFV